MGHQGFQSRYETRKRYYSNQRKRGLCPYCSRKPKEGKITCEYHLKQKREYSQRPEIKERDREYRKEYRQKNRKKILAYSREYSKKYYSKHKKNDKRQNNNT